MTTQEIRRIEDDLYRDSESHWFRLPEDLRDNLDIPTFMRRGIKVKTTKPQTKSPGVASAGAKQKDNN